MSIVVELSNGVPVNRSAVSFEIVCNMNHNLYSVSYSCFVKDKARRLYKLPSSPQFASIRGPGIEPLIASTYCS